MSDDQPKPVFGRTWADLVADSQTGPKLDAALARTVDFATTAAGVAAERIKRVFRRVDQSLEAAGTEPLAIPERVAIPVMEAVALEDRDELHELWARVLIGSATGQEVDEYVIGVVRQLSPDAANALRLAGSAWGQAFKGADASVPDVFQRRHQADLHSFSPFLAALPDEGRRVFAIARLQALGLLTSSPGGMGRVPIVPTDMGLVLMHILGEPPFEGESSGD